MLTSATRGYRINLVGHCGSGCLLIARKSSGIRVAARRPPGREGDDDCNDASRKSDGKTLRGERRDVGGRVVLSPHRITEANKRCGLT